MSTVDTIQDAVMVEMLRGQFAPGSWVRQDQLAKRLGVSKIPVREALQRLAAIGLLRFEPNRGVVVPTLSVAEAAENYALRSAIEPVLLAQAMPNLSIVDLAEAELALTRSDLSLTEANWAFHHALYRTSRWDRGLAMTQVLHAAVAPYVLLYTEGLGGAQNSSDEHLAMLDACRNRHVDQAVNLLAQHLDGAAAALHHYLLHRDSDS